jgi:hypothetical protein
MKASLFDAWCLALESGEYAQTGRELKTDVGYCCWGVACDLAGVTWVERSRPEGRERTFEDGYDPAFNDLPYDGSGDAAELVDLFGAVLGVDDQDLIAQFMNLNDLPTPFSEIATHLRARRASFVSATDER